MRELLRAGKGRTLHTCTANSNHTQSCLDDCCSATRERRGSTCARVGVDAPSETHGGCPNFSGVLGDPTLSRFERDKVCKAAQVRENSSPSAWLTQCDEAEEL